MENKKKAVIYCRVSTKEQVEEGNSLVTQERVCKEYALKNELEISEIFIEQGESAKTADRTELQRLLKFCSNRKNEISTVITYKIDRLSRNTDDYSQIRLLLRSYNVDIKSTSEFFEDTPSGRFMENIIANVAQFDNEVRTERSVGGMKEAVREGRYVWMAPIGYSNCKLNGKSTIKPNDLAPVVLKTFETVAQQIYPVNEIRELMFKHGLRGKQNGPFAKSAFYRMLRNDVYAGWIIKFGMKQKGTFDPIISEELFTKVQQVLGNPTYQYKAYKIKNPDFPLKRFVKAETGEPLTGSWSKGKRNRYPYYRFKKLKLNISKSKLEQSFISLLNNYGFDESKLILLRKWVVNALDEIKQSSTMTFINNKNQIISLKEKRDVLLQKNLDGIISDALLKEKLHEIQGKIYDAENSIDTKEAVKFDLSNTLHKISHILKNPGNAWLNLDFEKKLAFQILFFPEGVIFDGTKCRTPKLCSFIRLKDSFDEDLFSNVTHPVSNTNTLSSISNPDLQNSNLIFEYELLKDLNSLSNIMFR